MTIIESYKELKKAWNELIDALYRAWHIDKLIGMIVRGADNEQSIN